MKSTNLSTICLSNRYTIQLAIAPPFSQSLTRMSFCVIKCMIVRTKHTWSIRTVDRTALQNFSSTVSRHLQNRSPCSNSRRPMTTKTQLLWSSSRNTAQAMFGATFVWFFQQRLQGSWMYWQHYKQRLTN